MDRGSLFATLIKGTPVTFYDKHGKQHELVMKLSNRFDYVQIGDIKGESGVFVCC
jgi:hypothetical protein